MRQQFNEITKRPMKASLKNMESLPITFPVLVFLVIACLVVYYLNERKRLNDIKRELNKHATPNFYVLDGKALATETDFRMRTLDVNSYATRKTIAQGMLDLALLAANASQLKFLLSAGTEHQFYGLLLSLIIISLVLQALQAVICVILGMVFNINKVDEQRSAEIINNICVAINVFTVIINVVISAFDMRVIDDLKSGTTSE